MSREQLIAQAKEKYRQELIAKAKEKHQASAGGDQVQVSTGQGGSAGGTPAYNYVKPDPNYVEEMPDVLSAGDRAIAKNFAVSPEAQAAYIKQQYPNQQVTLKDNNVYMRSKSTEPWKAMDPDTGPFSKDFLYDVGDIGYDTVGGVAQSAATAAGALKGGLVTAPMGGWGAIPGAMAASSASGAGIETLRQGIGKIAGIPQDFDTGQIKTVGKIGAVTPLFLGAGNITKAPFAKSMLANASDDTINMLKNQQRGIPGRLIDWAGTKLSSVPTDAINAYSKHGQESIDNITKNGGLINYLDGVTDKANSAIKSERSKIGSEMNNAYGSIQSIDMASAKKPFLDAIQKMEADKAFDPTAWTPELESRLTSLKNGFDNVMPKANSVDGARYVDYQQSLKRLNNNFEAKMDPNNFDFLNAVNGSYANMNQGLDQASRGISSKLKGQYKDIKGLEEMAGNSFNDGQKLYNTLSGLDKGNRLQFREQVLPKVGDLGVDLQNPWEQTLSYKYFADPKLLPVGGGLTNNLDSSAAETIGRTIGGATGNLATGTYGGVKAGAETGGLLAKLGASPKVTKFVLDQNRKQIAPVYFNQNTATVPFLEYMYGNNNGK